MAFAMAIGVVNTTKNAEGVRAAAISAELSGRSPVDWCATWRSLRCGELSVRSTFSTAQRHYVLLAARPPSQGHDSKALNATLLEAWLRGAAQKFLSLEYGVAPSSLTSILRRVLTDLGVDCQPSRVPLMLGLLAQAASGVSPAAEGRIGELTFEDERLMVLGAPRPEATLVPHLTPAEYETLCLLVEGGTYAQIASVRAVSYRTVANQVASLFRSLGVSGRNELRGLLLCVSRDNTRLPAAKPRRGRNATPAPWRGSGLQDAVAN